MFTNLIDGRQRRPSSRSANRRRGISTTAMIIKFGHNIIGDNQPVYVIAEAGVNHNGDIKLAKQLVDVAKQAGADCVKFQTFTADEFISDKKSTYTYTSQGKEVTESQYEMFKRLEFSEKDWQEIINYCKEKGVVFATTAQSPSDLDFILKLTSLPFIKVGSDDLTSLDLISYYAKKGIPMVISAGMSDEAEISDAIETIQQAGNKQIVILHCVSSYPAKAQEVNLKKIPAIKNKFNVIVGFSDHTQGSAAATGAVYFGSKVIEKHFTLSHDLPGPDHWFSADPEELKKYIIDIRLAEQMIGSGEIVPTANEEEIKKIARRSIVAKTTITAGEKFTNDNLEFKRPGTGISPRFKKQLLGRAASQAYQSGDQIKENFKIN